MPTNHPLAWWNLVFLVPFGMGGVFLVLQAVGFDDQGQTEVDAGAGDVEVGADAGDLEVAGDGAAGELDADLDGEIVAAEVAPAGSGPHLPAVLVSGALAALGIGKAPLALLLTTLCFVWGMTGWVANAVLAPALVSPVAFFPISAALAGLASALASRTVAAMAVRWLPKTETHGVRDRDLLGRIGEALYPIEPGRQGVVRVADPHGNQLQYQALNIGPDPMPAGTPVILVVWDPRRGNFEVEVCPEDVRP